MTRRVALVTGSTRGLGRAIAERLGGDGFAVAVNGLHAAEAQRVADGIRQEGGVADGFPADVTDERSVTDLVVAITNALGPIDVLVVNATGPQPEADLADVGWDDHLAQLDFFVKSPLLLGRSVIPAMRAQHFGRIVHIDSEVADRPPPRRSANATAKNAQIGLTRSWARELAADGITVNTVAPGFIPVERHLDIPDRDRRRYVESVPAGRSGTPEDVAHVVSFLASDGAGFVTGQRILVDGGRSLYV
jgi:3-oxoacyl-[acyl-carrier protein] reductase